MSELLFDDIFMVETLDPDGKKYDKGMGTSYFFCIISFHAFKDQTAVWFWTWKLPQQESLIIRKYGSILFIVSIAEVLARTLLLLFS